MFLHYAFVFFVLLGFIIIIFFFGGGGGISCAVVFCIFFFFFGNLSGHDYFSKSFTKTHVVVAIYIKINNCIYKSLRGVTE